MQLAELSRSWRCRVTTRPLNFDFWQDHSEYEAVMRSVAPDLYRRRKRRRREDGPLYEIEPDGAARICRPLTVIETAQLLGVSHQAVQQVEARALRKLRDGLEALNAIG